jgi:hypothetical protein
MCSPEFNRDRSILQRSLRANGQTQSTERAAQMTGRANLIAPTHVTHRLDTLHATTRRVKLDRTRWSRNGPDVLVKPEQRTTKQRPDALQN